MYSDKPTVNLLTALMIEKGVRKVVVCPGSRNIPLVHNFSENPCIECYPVTDERSAAFYALGLSLATDAPVAVCVTSGSAVLNTAPAVAEAYYRHIPLVVISADRPMEWIDRQDGQTIRQNKILSGIVKHQSDIPDCSVEDVSAMSFASLSLNKCLNGCIGRNPGPAHINIQLDEPLFNFTTEQLPANMNILPVSNETEEVSTACESVINSFITSRNKLIIIGQINEPDDELDRILCSLRQNYLVLCEPLSSKYADPFECALPVVSETLDDTVVDTVISLGGNIVSKGLKRILRQAKIKKLFEVNRSGEPHATFIRQTAIVECDEKLFLAALLKKTIEEQTAVAPIAEQLIPVLSHVAEHTDTFCPDYSQLMAVKELETSLEDMEYDFEMHYANSMAVRLGCLLSSRRYIWCNRGVNGIEGSLSTAAGFSLGVDSKVFCVIGDLSFFYDQNALWNNMLRGNLRVMLLNNGGGCIFRRLKGLEMNEDEKEFITGEHHVNARGICEQNDIGYLSSHNEEEFRTALVHFLTEETSRPIVFEVFTDPDTDIRTLDQLDTFVKENI